MGEKKRLFLAVNLGVGVTRKIGDAVGRMRQVAERRALRVGWVPATNLHVTLKFLGWTAAEAVLGIRDRAREVAAARRPFEVTARGAGAFPSESAARVLWVGLKDASGGLAQLAGALDEEMAKLGFARETRPYTAHVTVGRVKDGKGAEEVLAPHRHADFGSSSIREVILYESIMRSTGSEYTALARVELGGGAAGTAGPPPKDGAGSGATTHGPPPKDGAGSGATSHGPPPEDGAGSGATTPMSDP